MDVGNQFQIGNRFAELFASNNHITPTQIFSNPNNPNKTQNTIHPSLMPDEEIKMPTIHNRHLTSSRFPNSQTTRWQ